MSNGDWKNVECEGCGYRRFYKVTYKKAKPARKHRWQFWRSTKGREAKAVVWCSLCYHGTAFPAGTIRVKADSCWA